MSEQLPPSGSQSRRAASTLPRLDVSKPFRHGQAFFEHFGVFFTGFGKLQFPAWNLLSRQLDNLPMPSLDGSFFLFAVELDQTLQNRNCRFQIFFTLTY